jgi:DNA repair protein RecO (recombination protein O)
MPLYTADALILRTYKLGEADRIVVFLTADRGKRRGVAKGARRLRSRFSGGLEPFTYARVAYVERENRDLVRLNYVEPVLSPLVNTSTEILWYTGYFAELINEWALEGDPSSRIFRLGVSVSAALMSGVALDRIARYFEYWLLRLQGVYPSVVVCRNCGIDPIEQGVVVTSDLGLFVCCKCQSVKNGKVLSPRALKFLRAASILPPDRLGDIMLTPAADRELATVHRLLIRTHLEKELKSVKVLQEFSNFISNDSLIAGGT